MVLLKGGRVFADGPKDQLMTSRYMTELFDVPLQASRTGDYFSLVGAY